MTSPHVPASTIPPQPADERRPENRKIIQQQYALRTNPAARYGPESWQETGVEFLYEADSVLVREKYLDAALSNLSAWWRRYGPPTDRPVEPAQELPVTV